MRLQACNWTSTGRVHQSRWPSAFARRCLIVARATHITLYYANSILEQIHRITSNALDHVFDFIFGMRSQDPMATRLRHALASSTVQLPLSSTITPTKSYDNLFSNTVPSHIIDSKWKLCIALESPRTYIRLLAHVRIAKQEHPSPGYLYDLCVTSTVFGSTSDQITGHWGPRTHRPI